MTEVYVSCLLCVILSLSELGRARRVLHETLDIRSPESLKLLSALLGARPRSYRAKIRLRDHTSPAGTLMYYRIDTVIL